jgi:hypothetical protein
MEELDDHLIAEIARFVVDIIDRVNLSRTSKRIHHVLVSSDYSASLWRFFLVEGPWMWTIWDVGDWTGSKKDSGSEKWHKKLLSPLARYATFIDSSCVNNLELGFSDILAALILADRIEFICFDGWLTTKAKTGKYPNRYVARRRERIHEITSKIIYPLMQGAKKVTYQDIVNFLKSKWNMRFDFADEGCKMEMIDYH